METTKEVCQAAIETMKKTEAALKLDLMLLELEAKHGMMDGMKLEDWGL